jgi:hypothetical protein
MGKHKLFSILEEKERFSYIIPLFWQHGEDERILREEIKQMCESGIYEFIVESRPHPDFLGEGWWHDLDIIIDEAKKRQMKVWIFDECRYPSGYAAGRIRDNYPQYLKTYLCERHIDAIGPLKGSSFLIDAWLEDQESLIAVVAAQRVDKKDRIDADSFVDLTSYVVDGVLYWDVPPGDWRIFLFIKTRKGGEEWTKDYLNPIDPKAVRLLIDIVYEEHYRRYSYEFGRTIAGFFSDEPRFGNVASYEATLGKIPMVLPYSDDLLLELNKEWQGDFKLMLPCLWYDSGSVTYAVRYTYMNVVSRMYSQSFTQQIGDWCREHGVKLIGHVVEDNGAHARLGFGSGHYFRSIFGQSWAGIDVVYQVWPGYDSGRFTTPFGYLDADFFYWGLVKMGSSAGHLDPKKEGVTVCEVFGAYGWQEGLKLMKWLTDHICVRGVNRLIPHAFSPKYPDPDCPPHFYARGANPQWRYFPRWVKYANRVCHLLSGGKHVAPVAVIYHAEAEWSGDYEPFEKTVKILLQNHIDCDVLPIDVIVNKKSAVILDGRLIINNESYSIIVVPYAEALPEEFLERLIELVGGGIYVFFIGGYPVRSSQGKKNISPLLAVLKANPYCILSGYNNLVSYIISLGLNDIEVLSDSDNKHLRYYHYINEDLELYFFTNEDKFKGIKAKVKFKVKGHPVLYDPMDNKLYKAQFRACEDSIIVDITLDPYESLFVIFGAQDKWSDINTRRLTLDDLANEYLIEDSWECGIATAEEYPNFRPASIIKGLGNVSFPGILPNFSGTILYKTVFYFDANINAGQPIILDLGEVYETAYVRLNGYEVGVRISPPYRLDISKYIIRGRNLLEIEVTNTLVKKIHDTFSRFMPQEPSGLIGPVRILY